MRVAARTVLTPKQFVELARPKKLDRSSSELTNVAVRAPALLEIEKRADGEADDESKPIRFTISTETVDRYDSTLSQDGWKLTNYRKNPVVCWAHRTYTDPPIGKSVDIGVEGGKLRASVEFVPREVSAFAAMIRQLVVRSFLRAASVSWDPLKWVYNDERGWSAVDYLEQDLLEWSIVPVPGNPETLAEARSAGIDLAPLAGWAEEHLDHLVGRELDELEQRSVVRLEAIRRAAGAERRPMVFLDQAERLALRSLMPKEPGSVLPDVSRLVGVAERIEAATAALERAASGQTAAAVREAEEKAKRDAALGSELAKTIGESARGAVAEMTRRTTGRID